MEEREIIRVCTDFQFRSKVKLFTIVCAVVAATGFILGTIIGGDFIEVAEVPILLCGLLAIIGVIILLLLQKFEIRITNLCVYGTKKKEQVVIPNDSISAVKKGRFKSIIIVSSSGKIAFPFVKQRDELFNAVVELLKERQAK